MQVEHIGILVASLVSVGAFVKSILETRQRKSGLKQERELREKDMARLDLDEFLKRQRMPKVEFTLGCNIWQPGESDYLSEIVMSVHNKGAVQLKAVDTLIKVRGLRAGTTLESDVKSNRLAFVDELLRVKPFSGKWGFFFVEPGVRQLLTFPMKIPEGYSHILVRVIFKYGEVQGQEYGRPHSAERIFEVKPGMVKPLEDEMR